MGLEHRGDELLPWHFTVVGLVRRSQSNGKQLYRDGLKCQVKTSTEKERGKREEWRRLNRTEEFVKNG
jgi:hypothetical protein